MKLIIRAFDYGGDPILALVFICLFIAKCRSQLRKRKHERCKRIIINTIGSIPAFTLLPSTLLVPSNNGEAGRKEWGNKR